MDESKVREIAEHFFPALLSFLGLGDWSVTIHVESICGESNEVAIINLDDGYLQGYLTIDPTKMKNEGYLLDVLAHEAFHVLINPAQQTISTLMDSEPEKLKALCRVNVERTIRSLETIWQSHLCHEFMRQTDWYKWGHRQEGTQASDGALTPLTPVAQPESPIVPAPLDGAVSQVKKPKPKRVRTRAKKKS